MAVVKITQGLVERQPFSTDGTRWLFDKELRGFALAVGKTTKTFYASCEANGRTLRRKIGRAAVLTAPQARTLAREMLVDLRRGIDARRPTSETLAAALETYLQRRRLKATSARQYRDAFNLYLRAWLNRDILSLTRAEVDQRHRAIGRTAPYSANLVFRILRAVLADARKRGVLTDNACDAIAWYPEARRQTRIGARLPEWWAATERLENPIRRACLRVILLQGYRMMEVCRLRWSDLNLGTEPTVLLRDRKRGPDIVLPLSRHAAQILRDLEPIAQQAYPGTPFCFPSYGQRKHVVEPNDATIPNSTHDLRREWLSTAAEVGVPLLLAKAAVGHSLGGDVTTGYMTGLDVRAVVDRVADEIMRRAQHQREDLDATNEVRTGLAALTV